MSVEQEIDLMLRDSKYKALVKAVGLVEALKMWRNNRQSKSKEHDGAVMRFKEITAPAYDPFFGDLCVPASSTKQVKSNDSNPYSDLFGDMVKG